MEDEYFPKELSKEICYVMHDLNWHKTQEGLSLKTLHKHSKKKSVVLILQLCDLDMGT